MGPGRYDDEDHEEDDSQADVHGVAGLLDDSVVLIWWADPGNTAGEFNLPFGGDEVCAVTPSNDLAPYASEFEGYMGNYGNTVDRWYRRAALVLWPRECGFAVRAEASPGWALDAILASLDSGDQAQARRVAEGLAAAWGRTAPVTLLSPALEVAAGVTEDELALAVLAPFDVQLLSAEHAGLLAGLAQTYPATWWIALRARWDGGLRVVREDRQVWVESNLRAVCRELESVSGRPVVSWLGSWMSDWLVAAVDSAVQERRVAQRDRDLGGLGPSVAAILAMVGEQKGAAIVEHLRTGGDVVLPLLVSAVRSHEPPASTAILAFGTHARDLLTEVLARSERKADDWSISWNGPGGEDSDKLATFLASAALRTLEWPLAALRRQSVHQWIDDAALPVQHLTRRTGRPYTLVLHKTDELFTRERAARRRAEEDLAVVRRFTDRRDMRP